MQLSQFMISLFIRTGLWAYWLCLLALLGWKPQSLNSVLYIWLICTVASLLTAMVPEEGPLETG